ncbi:MAG: HPr(Ser) kinase/phosphatase [Polyangiaceae bacterium]
MTRLGGNTPSEGPRAAEVTVAALTSDPRIARPSVGHAFQRYAGEGGLSRPIRHPRVQKNGLALAGHYHGVVPTRVQVLGETELSYLGSLSEEARSRAVRGLFSLGLSCVVVSKGEVPPSALVSAAEATSTPLFGSHTRTSATINAIHAALDDLLAPTARLHGVLVDVFGVGLLLLGKSGIGKSECALELVLRGHRLVADDVVICDFRPPGMVFGEADPVLKNHMEIRGLGILNVKDMFGVTAVRDRKRIDIVVRLEPWEEGGDYDRLGIDDTHDTILGVRIRMLLVPVQSGRDMGSILEIAARNELLRRAGTHSARNFVDRLNRKRDSLPPESMFPPPSSRHVIPAPESSVAFSLESTEHAFSARDTSRPLLDPDPSVPEISSDFGESAAYFPVRDPESGEDP